MPTRLRPKAPVAADAILVGDPGRSLLLAQELLEEPRMSNHARGLWGYSGRTPEGGELTIQATGIGGPSAAAVLADLAELGVSRAIRVGTCTALGEGVALGELLIVSEAIGDGGSAASFGLAMGDAVAPERALYEGLVRELDETARTARVASFDSPPATAMRPDSPQAGVDPVAAGAVAADMQTVALLSRGHQLGVAVAALLIVSEAPAAGALADEAVEETAKRGGRAATRVFQPLS